MVLLLVQLLKATSSPLVIGGNDIFDQEFLSSFPSASNPLQNTAQSDTIFPTENNHAEPTPESTTYPSWFTSTLMARRLLALSKTGIVSTTFPNPLRQPSHIPADVAGLSIPLPEYIADCDDSLPPSTDSNRNNNGEGNPTFLALHVGTTFRNTAAGSNISLSIDWWDHLSETNPIYPGFPLSAAGLPRVTLFGYVEPFPYLDEDEDEETERALEKCFFRAHPDARAWAPRNKDSPHASFWARMVVTRVYWIGGFGDVQRIGWIDVDDWKGVRGDHSLPGVGDGRGWMDVRLPGEKE